MTHKGNPNWHIEAAHITGIERTLLSPSRGEIVCPIVMLWKEPTEPGVGASANNLAGALKHGDEVQVTAMRNLWRTWYYVEAPPLPGRPTQAGWVLAAFLETLGA